MLDSQTINITVDRPWKALYEAFWRPEHFPRWASGLSRGGLKKDGDRWVAQGPEGPVIIRFTGHNAFGVMDHWVDLGGEHVIAVPLRIIENGSGSTVLLTLFRQPEMADAKFIEDAAWIARDLATLKRLAEA